MFAFLFNRYTALFFFILFVLNTAATTIIYSIGLTTGYEGQLSWGWDQYVQTLNGLFGNLNSLAALLGGLVALIIAFAVAGWLAHGRHVVAAMVWFGFGFVVGGFLLFRAVDWSGISFGFMPVLILIAFTAIEVTIGHAIFARMHRVPAQQPNANEAAPAAAQ
jgi:hypothetical protein